MFWTCVWEFPGLDISWTTGYPDIHFSLFSLTDETRGIINFPNPYLLTIYDHLHTHFVLHNQCNCNSVIKWSWRMLQVYLKCKELQLVRFSTWITALHMYKIVLQSLTKTSHLQRLWWTPGISGGRIYSPTLWNNAAKSRYQAITNLTSDCQQTPSCKRKYGCTGEDGQANRDTRYVS